MKRLRGNVKRLALAGTIATCLVIGLSTATASALSPQGAFLSQTQTAHSANVYLYSVTWGTDAGPFLGGGTMNLTVLWHGSDFIQAGTGILQGTLAGCPAPVGPQGFTWTGSGEPGQQTGGDSFDAVVISNTSSLRLTLGLTGFTVPGGAVLYWDSYSYYCGGHLYTGEQKV
jgi:hypothetical protein